MVPSYSKLIDEVLPQLRKMQRAVDSASAAAARSALDDAVIAAVLAGPFPRTE